jgi:hypothetical protein
MDAEGSENLFLVKKKKKKEKKKKKKKRKIENKGLN